MDFRLTPQQELFKKTVRSFCEEKLFPRAREIDEKEAGIPEEIPVEGDQRRLGHRPPQAFQLEGRELLPLQGLHPLVPEHQVSLGMPLHGMIFMGAGFGAGDRF